MELARGSGSDHQAHDRPEIVACDVDQIALVDVISMHPRLDRLRGETHDLGEEGTIDAFEKC